MPLQLLPLLGLALAAAGTGVSMTAAESAKKAANDQLLQQLNKQREYQKRATPIFEQSLSSSQPEEVQSYLNQDSQTNKQLLNFVQNTMPSSTRENPLERVRSNAAINQQNQANAALQALRNFSTQQFLQNRDTSNQLGVVSGLSAASAQNSPYLINQAMQSQSGLSGIGSLMSTAGGLTALAGSLNQPSTSAGFKIPSSAVHRPITSITP